jgi:hypothetical protein
VMLHAVTRWNAAQRVAAALVLSAFLLISWPALAHASGIMGFNRETYAYSSQYSISQEANSYQQMVLQSTDASLVPQLKAANPKLKVFLYEGIVGAENQNPAYTTCTSGRWDLLNQPSWILKDQNGNPVLNHLDYIVDAGNTSYQRTCLQNAIATAKAGGFDGVYWDMVNQNLAWDLPSGTTVPAYPTTTSWDNALTSMLTYGEQQLHANGLMQVANIGGAFLTPGLWQTWNGLLDGAEDEGFSDPGSGLAAGVWAWPKQLANLQWSEAHGKMAIVHSHNATEAGNSYGLASLMLIANGNSTYSTSNNCYSSCEVWYPEYTTANQLGAPVGSYFQLPNGVYERYYQHGVVVVNPTMNSVPTFSLGGDTYSGSQLTNVTSVSMGPTSGYILLDTSPAAVAPVDTVAPSISPAPTLGTKLTASPGTWTGSPAPVYAYQWSRCTSGICAPISGATSSTYTVQSADIGSSLQVNVTATNSGGIASASSAQTTVVAAPSFTLTDSPGSITLTHGSGVWVYVYVNPINGFSNYVTMQVTGLPAGASYAWVPQTTKTKTILAINTTAASIGTSHLTITGTSGSLSATTSFTLTVK